MAGLDSKHCLYKSRAYLACFPQDSGQHYLSLLGQGVCKLNKMLYVKHLTHQSRCPINISYCYYYYYEAKYAPSHFKLLCFSIYDHSKVGTQKKVSFFLMKREWGRVRSLGLSGLLGKGRWSTEMVSHSQSLLVPWEGQHRYRVGPAIIRGKTPSLFLQSGPSIHRKPDKSPEKAQSGASGTLANLNHFSSFSRHRSMSPETKDIAAFTTEHWKQSQSLTVRYYFKKWCYVHRRKWIFCSNLIWYSLRVFITWGKLSCENSWHIKLSMCYISHDALMTLPIHIYKRNPKGKKKN